MTHKSPPADGIVEVRELNRLFLGFLRQRLAAGGSSMGLPGPAAGALAGASDDVLSRLAAWPQALFGIDLGALSSHDRQEPGVTVADAQRTALQSMLLVSARHLSRADRYAARVYLRLTAAEVDTLAEITLPALSLLASRRGVVRCAYRRLRWMWPELVNAPRPDRARALILLGLQPRIELNRPLPYR